MLKVLRIRGRRALIGRVLTRKAGQHPRGLQVRLICLNVSSAAFLSLEPRPDPHARAVRAMRAARNAAFRAGAAMDALRQSVMLITIINTARTVSTGVIVSRVIFVVLGLDKETTGQESMLTIVERAVAGQEVQDRARRRDALAARPHCIRRWHRLCVFPR
jgi:hypothetical protein